MTQPLAYEVCCCGHLAGDHDGGACRLCTRCNAFVRMNHCVPCCDTCTPPAAAGQDGRQPKGIE